MPATTIALLPFENFSGDPAQDVIARGLSLDLAVELSHQPGRRSRAIWWNAGFPRHPTFMSG
jgi:hypothetical protein